MAANYRRVKPSQIGRSLLRCVYDAAHDKPRPLGLSSPRVAETAALDAAVPLASPSPSRLFLSRRPLD